MRKLYLIVQNVKIFSTSFQLSVMLQQMWARRPQPAAGSRAQAAGQGRRPLGARRQAPGARL